MKKILKLIIVVLSMLFIFDGYNARADDKKIYTITFSIDGNADLQARDINILFEYEDKNTALITLKHVDGYKKEQMMLEGKTIVKQIDVLGDIGQYKYSYNKEFNITEDKEFILTINSKKLESISEKIEEDTNVIDNTSIKEDKEDKEMTVNYEEKEDASPVKENKYKNLLKNTGNKILNAVISSSIVIIIVAVIFLLYRLKKGVK